MREYSFTCFRYFSNLGLFVFCLMKLSILALASRIVTTLLANLANPSYRVQLLDTETTCINMLTEHMVDIFHIITVVLFLYWYANCQHGTYTLQQLSLNHPERERGDLEKLKISVSPYAQFFEAFPPTWHFKVAQPLWKDAGGPTFDDLGPLRWGNSIVEGCIQLTYPMCICTYM